MAALSSSEKRATLHDDVPSALRIE